MTTAKTFEEVEAWNKARILAREVYQMTEDGKFRKYFSLKDQVRRASVSIMANIAEGFERGGRKEFIQFLSLAKASTGELRSHLYIALDRGYIQQTRFDELKASCSEISRMIAGFMKYLSRTEIKGHKYR